MYLLNMFVLWSIVVNDANDDDYDDDYDDDDGGGDDCGGWFAYVFLYSCCYIECRLPNEAHPAKVYVLYNVPLTFSTTYVLYMFGECLCALSFHTDPTQL